MWYPQKADPQIPSVEWVRALINDQINKFAATGSGDVTGAASSTDKAIVRWNGLTGKIIQDSPITITDAGLIRLVNGTAAGVSLGNSATNGFIYGVNTVSVVTNGVERWIVNASGALNPILDNTYDIGNLSVNPRDIHVSRNVIFKVTGGGSNNLSFIAPAAANTLQYILPATDPTVGQVLIASAPAAGIVTLSWGLPTPRVQSVVSAATVTPNADADDEVIVTAQAAALLLANPTGTPVQGQAMIIRLKDDGTGRAITYDTEYRAIGVTLPTTTVANKTVYLGMIFNSTDTSWDVTGVSEEA